MPAAPGGAGSWHLPPTCPGVGSTLCSLSGQLCWLPTCQVASPVPSWGCWLCPGQGHPLGCQRGRDTWRHLETQSICAPSVLLARPRGVCPVPAPRVLLPMSCSPFPAPHSLLPMLAPHSPCSAPCACSPFPAPHATPCPAALAGTHGSRGAAGLVGTTVSSVCVEGGGLWKFCGVRKAVAVRAMSVPLAGALQVQPGGLARLFGASLGLALEGGCAGGGSCRSQRRAGA